MALPKSQSRPRDGTGRPASWGAGPTLVITDLGILRPEPTHELTLTADPGVKVEQACNETGWNLRVAPEVEVTELPTTDELAVLGGLKQRTEEAHRR